MRMVGAGMTAALLLAGLAASASAQDYDGDLHSAPKTKSWWDGWFSAAPKPPAPKPDSVEAPVHVGPSPAELAALAHQRERADLDRRNEVCDRLMEIAVRKNDEAMEAQVEQLRDRSWEVYQQRTAALSVSKPDASAPESKPKPKYGRGEVKP